jgi:hypothetical protein
MVVVLKIGLAMMLQGHHDAMLGDAIANLFTICSAKGDDCLAD